MRKLVIASGNQGKLRELAALLEPLDFEVHTQAEFNVAEVPETGTTFVENAIIKARNAAQQKSAIVRLSSRVEQGGNSQVIENTSLNDSTQVDAGFCEESKIPPRRVELLFPA